MAESRAAAPRQQCIGAVGLLLLLLLLGACASQPRDDGAPPASSTAERQLPPDAVPRKEAKSRYGNPPVYEVFGVRYHVMDSSHGYRERGVASWYGNKFHGRATSSQEPYDMYAMTAAHKTLPLPTYVRVRNLKNGKSVVVRVNDRGPFVDNRIIDLSYSAATKLDMIREGTALVEVTAFGFDDTATAAGRSVVAQSAPVPAAPAAGTVATAGSPVPSVSADAAPADTTPANDEHDVFVQVGAFGDADNARRRYALLRDSGISNAVVHKDVDRSPVLYRIRIGPINGVDDYDTVVAKLGRIGITESHLVTE